MRYVIFVSRKPHLTQKSSNLISCAFRKDEPGHQVTKNAISSIFFAESSEPQSVLLKRGPVLLGGEERELMIFTNGFLFSRVELNKLVNLLLDVDPEGAEDHISEQLSQRFHDIDIDRSGCK